MAPAILVKVGAGAELVEEDALVEEGFAAEDEDEDGAEVGDEAGVEEDFCFC